MFELRLRGSPVKFASLLIFDKFNGAGKVPRSGLTNLQRDSVFFVLMSQIVVSHPALFHLAEMRIAAFIFE